MPVANLIVRRAKVADLVAVVAMLADDDLGQTREDTSVPINEKYRMAFDAINADANQYLAIAQVDGEIAGCLQLTFIPGLSRTGMWRGQIESVRIASAYRGHGLGRELFLWAIAHCREKDCQLVQLATDKSRADARRFYESLGFEATHDGMKLAL